MYEKELMAFVRSRIFDKSLAPDIMQEVAIKIYENRDKLNTLDNCRAWLYRVTRNTLIDFYRKNDRAIPSELYSLELLVDNHNDEQEELSGCITGMMSTSLNKSDNEILQLSIIDQYSLKEIATHMNLTVEGAKTKLKRAKKKLSSAFFECCSLQKDVRGGIVGHDMHDDEQCGC
jgi:RNA polymerase sigma-70 factor (ECF subfamily)